MYVNYEKCTKTFFAMGQHKNKHVIDSIKRKTGGRVSTDQAILSEFHKFYERLYAKPHIRLEKFEDFIEDGLTNIKDDDAEMLRQLLDLEELSNTLKAMQNGKSLGSDGFLVEFYKYFWKDIDNLVYASAMKSFDKGKMNISQRRGIIALLPKKGKDTAYVENWRPITLLNIDYKIVVKAIAARLKSMLPKLIHPDQNGFVHDWYIGQTVMDSYAIIDNFWELDMEGVLVSIDFYKAFDTVSREFLDKVLKGFGFPEDFIKWINVLLTDTESRIINNGYLSEKLK